MISDGFQTWTDVFKGARKTTKRSLSLLDGLAKNAVALAGKTDSVIAEELQDIKKYGDLKKKAFGIGAHWTSETMANGVKKFKLDSNFQKNLRKMKRVGESLSSLCTFIAPIFIVSDLIWGSAEEQK